MSVLVAKMKVLHATVSALPDRASMLLDKCAASEGGSAAS
jgi:hypothetical protein